MTKQRKAGDILGEAVKRAETAVKADKYKDMTPLEVSRSIIRGEIPKPEKKPIGKISPLKEVTRGWLDEQGWEDLEAKHEEWGDSGTKTLADCITIDGRGFSDAKAALNQILGLKPGTSTFIKESEAGLISDFIVWYDSALNDRQRHAMEERRKSRFEIMEIPGEHGPLFTDRTTLTRMITSVDRGKHMLLIGEPGVAKTDFARALAPLTERELYHMEMSGLSDVGQLAAQQYLEEQNGATVTTLKSTPIIEALEAAEAGRSVVLVLDEFPRVTDPQIHNPLLLLMSHNEFHDPVSKRIYRVSPENFVIVATGNFDAGRNFSGNNRRGVDDASLDRFRVIRLERPPRDKVPAIIDARVDLSSLSAAAGGNVLRAAEELYALATKDEIKRLITVRSVISVIDAWVSLDPKMYSLGEVVKLELEHRPGTDVNVLDGITSSLELKGL